MPSQSASVKSLFFTEDSIIIMQDELKSTGIVTTKMREELKSLRERIDSDYISMGRLLIKCHIIFMEIALSLKKENPGLSSQIIEFLDQFDISELRNKLYNLSKGFGYTTNRAKAISYVEKNMRDYLVLTNYFFTVLGEL